MQTILTTDHLNKQIGGKAIVSDLNMHVAKGEIYGFLGPNGAGKTTTMKMITNQWKPTSGEIVLFGQKLLSDSYSLLKRMGSIIEFPVFYDDLTAEEIIAIQKAPRKRAFATIVGPILSKRTAIGWIYTGHTGEDLFLYAFGPNKPTGLIENTDIAKITAQSLGFILSDTSRQLFVDTAAALAALGAVSRLDLDDPNHPVLLIEKGLRRAQLPVDSNQLIIGAKTHSLPGIVVQIPKTGKVFAPQAAIDLLKAAGW